MTKHHHPISRAERLSLREDAPVQYTKPTHAKKRRKEILKDQETLDALRQAKASRASLSDEYEPD